MRHAVMGERSQTILLVNDEPANVQILERLLTSSGLFPSAIDNGPETGCDSLPRHSTGPRLDPPVRAGPCELCWGATMGMSFCTSVEMESVAYIVCDASGLDTSDYSFRYVAT